MERYLVIVIVISAVLVHSLKRICRICEPILNIKQHCYGVGTLQSGKT